MSNINDDKTKDDLVDWYITSKEKEQYCLDQKKAKELFSEIITHSRIKQASERHL